MITLTRTFQTLFFLNSSPAVSPKILTYSPLLECLVRRKWTKRANGAQLPATELLDLTSVTS